MKRVSTALLLSVLASCTSLGIPPIKIPIQGKGESKPTPTPAASEESPNLYARDGTVVSASPQGEVTSSGQLGHDLQPSNGGRMYILELYQKVIDERDALQMEVGALTNDNERRRQATARSEERVADLEERLRASETQRRALADENMELASRLTTAQIRRLEAERLLLEAKIREAQGEVNASAEPGQ